MRRCNYLYLILFVAVSISACHLEQGKLYFDELNLDPILIYQMAPLETAIYCFAEGDIPEGRNLEKMHVAAMEAIEKNPETENWGQLVCLALSEHATIKQMRETINVLQLVIAVRHKQSTPARSFKKLIEQQIQFKQDIDQTILSLQKEQQKTAGVERRYEEELTRQKSATEAQIRRVKELEEKVKKLQEIELLLHPKEKT